MHKLTFSKKPSHQIQSASHLSRHLSTPHHLYSCVRTLGGFGDRAQQHLLLMKSLMKTMPRDPTDLISTIELALIIIQYVGSSVSKQSILSLVITSHSYFKIFYEWYSWNKVFVKL